MRTDLRLAVLVGGLGGLLTASGCATTHPGAAFDVTREYVRTRTGVAPNWAALAPEDDQVATRTRTLLEGDLNLDAAVEIAVLNNRRLQAEYEELGIARAELVQAGLLVNPVLAADVTFGLNRAGEAAAIGVTQNFVRALLIPLRTRVARERLDAATFEVAAHVIELVTEVKQAFVRAQATIQLVELDRTIVEATRLSADFAARQRAAGNITDLDLVGETALYEDARARLALDESAAAVAHEDLTVLMGLWGPEARWTIAVRLAAPLADVPLAGLETLAVTQRVDLAAARRESEALHQALGLTGLAGVMADAEGGLAVEREIDDGTWSIGPALSIPLPLFDQGQATRAEALARLRQNDQRFAALAIEIRSQVRRAHAQLRAAQALAAQYERAILPLRARVVEQAQLQYNAMQIGVLHLLQAKQSQIDAGRAYVEALEAYWRARIDLDAAVGGSVSWSASAMSSAEHSGGEL